MNPRGGDENPAAPTMRSRVPQLKKPPDVVEPSSLSPVYYVLKRKEGKPMSFEIIADYRSQAGECLSRSKTTGATETKMLWLTIAEDWLLLADRVEMNEARSAIKLVDDGDASAAIGNWA